MKHIFAKLVSILAASCLIISCSTNTQKENTVAGAATGAVAGGLLGSLATGAGAGWVIAGGAVVGGVIGGLIGHDMDSVDKSHINSTMNNTPTNKTTHWKSKHGASYSMTPTSNKMAVNGNNMCRTFTATSTLKGDSQTTHGTACRQANGDWETIKA